MRSLVVVLAFVCLVLAPVLSKADCVSYTSEQERFCVGAGGCEGMYAVVGCMFGCVSGVCDSHGASGICCGRLWYTAAIYPDGGDCRNVCPDIPLRIARQSQHRESKNIRPRLADVLGPVRLTAELSYSVPRIVLLPDRCRHTFEVVEPSEAEWAGRTQ